MRPNGTRVTKIIWDDFAPRFEYPQKMRELEEYCKKSGSDYGKYVEKNPDKPKPKKEEVKTRSGKIINHERAMRRAAELKKTKGV